LSRDRVIMYGVWIGNCIYSNLTDPWLQVIITVSLIHTLIQFTDFLHWVFTSRLVTASNGSRSPFSGFPNCPGVSWSNSQLTQLHSTVLPITSQHGQHRKYRSNMAVQLLPWKHACSRSCYTPTAVIRSPISRSMPSNGFTCHNLNK
jgi:hypothetical protein